MSDSHACLSRTGPAAAVWWRGTSRPQALTADTASGAGLQGGNDDAVPSSDGGAATASPEGDSPPTTSDLVAQLSFPVAAQEGGLDQQSPAPLRSGAARPVTGPAEALRGVAADSQSPQPATSGQGAAADPEGQEGSSSCLTPAVCVAAPNLCDAGPNSRT